MEVFITVSTVRHHTMIYFRKRKGELRGRFLAAVFLMSCLSLLQSSYGAQDVPRFKLCCCIVDTFIHLYYRKLLCRVGRVQVGERRDYSGISSRIEIEL